MGKKILEQNVEVADEVTNDDFVEATSLKLSDDEMAYIPNEVAAAGNKKRTGFEASGMKTIKESAYKTNFVDVFDLVTKDPNRAYKQIDFNKFRANGGRDPRGWVPLTKLNKTVENFPSPQAEYGISLPDDGLWHVGDRIWAWMPRQNYMQVRKMLRDKTNLRAKGLSDQFKRDANRLGFDQKNKKNLEIEYEVQGPG